MKLNPSQIKAVSEIEGPVLVVAGPGTGKTQVLSERIAEILRKTQTNPENILALTFTEAGVINMRERLCFTIGETGHYVDIYTFHSFCNDIIQKWPDKFAFAKELEAITEVEKIQLMKRILDSLPHGNPLLSFYNKYTNVKSILGAISELKREGVSVEEFSKKVIEEEANFKAIEDLINPKTGKMKTKYSAKQKQIEKQRELINVYGKYQEGLSEKGRYDYEDMIMFVIEKFKTDDFLLGYYQEKYQYFLIDEYQDTNSAQNKIIELLGNYFENPNIFVVGDDDQAIYRFQGASLENILEFANKYPTAKKIILTQNYRSDQKILDKARNLIQHNDERLENKVEGIVKNLKSDKSEKDDDVYLCEFNNENEEAYFIVKKIEELKNAGEKLSEIAVLYRNNKDPDDLVRFLKKAGIPYEISNGNNILQDVDIQKIISVLSLINNPKDDLNFFKVLNFDFIDIDREDLYKLTKSAYKKSYWEIIGDPSVLKSAELKDPIKLNNFKILVDNWISYSANLTFVDFFEKVIHESKFMDYVLNKEDLGTLNRLKGLFDEVKKINSGDHALKLKIFLEMLQDMNENNVTIEEVPLTSGKDCVKLKTVHKAKGLEFNNVFIMKCVANIWEKKRGNSSTIKLPDTLLKLQGEEHDEEEDTRRLFYVALTRAKKKVFLTYSKNGKKPQEKSVFIDNIEKSGAENGIILRELDTSPYIESAKERLSLYLSESKEDPLEISLEPYLKDLAEEYILNPTALNNYLSCPRKFFYSNLIQVPHVKPKHMCMGTAIHEALKDFFDKYKKEKKLPEANFMIESFQKRLKKQVMTADDMASSSVEGLEIIKGYYERERDNMKISLANEHQFRKGKVFMDGISITGKIDRIDIIDDKLGTVCVTDYKTGKSKTENAIRGMTENGTGDEFRQLIFYKILGDCDPKFRWHIMSGEIYFVTDGKRVSITCTNADIESLKRAIKEVHANIQELKFDKVAKGKPCERCQFKEICWGK